MQVQKETQVVKKNPRSLELQEIWNRGYTYYSTLVQTKASQSQSSEYCKSNNYWRNGNVAVPELFIYSGGKRGWNYLEWRKAGGELFRVTVTGKNIYIYTHTHIYIYLYIYLYIYIFFWVISEIDFCDVKLWVSSSSTFNKKFPPAPQAIFFYLTPPGHPNQWGWHSVRGWVSDLFAMAGRHQGFI